MASGAFTNFRAGVPQPAECFGIGVGLMELIMFGVAGVLNPLEFSKGFGVPMLPASHTQAHPGALQKSPEEEEKGRKLQKTQEGYIMAIAARNLQNGVLLLTLGCYVRDRRALGIAVASGVVTTVSDALIVWAQGPEASSYIWGHLIGVVNSIAIGGSLLYWGKGEKLA
ncbi:hypothetical protein KC332_g5852 [Hortaea werneckii]|uniref:DUF4267 domain-containing protein n=1 Tax=Hortaea werneckii TaxID=91943 RepID=A0A3M7ICY8_HORWE|nr:hypothetical protein KC350_g5336 [Hortaea werneckii]KAI6987748.1 hypothetical protein KC329_g5804 [Hortaea werneckii]KAI7039017.1 hypothetical protein KC366_g6351 [Hortaea werneckii]KAI7073750.1 hypothetical protein KC327_g5719 [Hortaea werneckii]KAI7131117.1 hypothetical protein KC337_g6396 [Hortaea werneckii]